MFVPTTATGLRSWRLDLMDDECALHITEKDQPMEISLRNLKMGCASNLFSSCKLLVKKGALFADKNSLV